MGRSRISKVLILSLVFTLAHGAPKFGDLFNGEAETAEADASSSQPDQVRQLPTGLPQIFGGNQNTLDIATLIQALGGQQNPTATSTPAAAPGLPGQLATLLGNAPAINNDRTENCRVRPNANGNTAQACSQLIAPGTCRFDFVRNQCLCPVTEKETCESTTQCFWLSATRNCIHQTERLYNALFDKLVIRGKKDLAIQVFYNSRPAPVSLPYGINGPQVLDIFGGIRGLNVRYPPMPYGLGLGGHLSYGAPSYVSPSYGGSAYGHNPYGGYGAQPYGGAYGSHSYGGNQYGQDPYGPPSYGGNHYGQDPYGPPSYGGNQYGQDPYGPPTYGGNHYGQDPYGPPSYGGNPYGQDPYGPPSYGGNNYGPKPYGGDSYGEDSYGPKGYGGDGSYGPPKTDDYGQDYKGPQSYEEPPYKQDPYAPPMPYGGPGHDYKPYQPPSGPYQPPYSGYNPRSPAQGAPDAQST